MDSNRYDNNRYPKEYNVTPRRRSSKSRHVKQDKLYDSDNSELSCDESVGGICSTLSPRSK